MTVAAFLYDNYYCWSPKKSFAGVFADVDEAKESLRGGRGENQNLETLDLDTYEFLRFVWNPIYERKEEDGKEFFKLCYKNGANAPEPEWIEAEYWPPSAKDGRYSTETQAKFNAGIWSEND